MEANLLSPDADNMQRRWQEMYDRVYTHPYYFRDSYNDSSLLWKLDLSWWGDLQSYIDDEAVMHPEEIKLFEHEIRIRSELLAKNVDALSQQWRDYFFTKYDTFLDFLKQAHEGNYTILCSV
jgi:hypothetical protein